TRIEESFKTINALLENNAKIIIIAHYDRPEGKFDQAKSLRPVSAFLFEKLNQPVSFVDYQPEINQISFDPHARISLVDNLRFWQEEEDNNPDFAQTIASWGQVYINEAFANCHRAHAS